MKFKIDENLPDECAELLRTAGFETHTIEDEKLSGVDDSTVAECCRLEQRVFVTLDLDFANVMTYPPSSQPGIIVLRTKLQDKATIVALLNRVIRVLPIRDPSGELWIVEQDRIRFRQDH